MILARRLWMWLWASTQPWDSLWSTRVPIGLKRRANYTFLWRCNTIPHNILNMINYNSITEKKITALSGQMLTFNGVLHFWDVFSLRMNPGFHSRWQTVCMASCGWAVCWCQLCGSSGPWWRWGSDMGRRMLWTTNTGAFYWWHFECT